MTYTFVTREEIDDCIRNDGSVQDNLIVLRELAIRLLAERDAYQEVAIRRYGAPKEAIEDFVLSEHGTEAEAARILEGK